MGFWFGLQENFSLLLRRVLPPDESLHVGVGDCTIRLQNTQGLSDLGFLLRSTSFHVSPIDRGYVIPTYRVCSLLLTQLIMLDADLRRF